MTPIAEESLLPLKNDPMVSILINCKNGVRTIKPCLDAILAQTYRPIEMVFQDGGSTDGTLDIVKEYMNLHPGLIRLKAEPDSCAEEGFFRGLKACVGDIIYPACADEEMLPDSVSWGVAQLQHYSQAGAVYGDVYVHNAKGEIISTWHGRPFSLKNYLCREVDPPFAASFFRREAIWGTGLLTRNWTWGIGEFEFWLRIGMKYPVQYVPGLVARYAFHPGTGSFGQFLDHEHFVSVREAFFDRFFTESDLPESIRGMKNEAIIGLHLFMGEVLRSIKEYSNARLYLEKALERIPNGSRLVALSHKLSMAGQDIETLRTHITAHLAHIPRRRIACYGAGNDFLELLSSGVFASHNVVAIVDNFRPKGELVGGVPIIRESDLGQISPDIIIVTSSAWIYELREAATRWSLNNSPYIPVI